MDWLEAYPKSKFLRGFTVLGVLVSAGYITIFIIISVLRSVYPFELEWIEGAGLDEIRWILQGRPLFGPPSISFVPSMKTPLYYYLSAGLSKITVMNFFAPRLLSIAATLGIFILLYLIVTNNAANPTAGIFAAGMMAASFRFSGAWMDLAKTDSLFMFFILAGFYSGEKVPNQKGLLLSGLFYILAYYTKQLALVVIIVLCISSLIETRGRSSIQWLIIGGSGLSIYFLTDRFTHGWFSFYTTDTLKYHNWGGNILTFSKNALAKIWPAALISLIYGILLLRDTLDQKFKRRNRRYLFLAAALAASSASVFLKSWTYDNGYIPLAAGISILTGLGFDHLVRSDHPSLSAPSGILLKIGAIVLVLLQFGYFAYNPIQQLPTREDLEAAQYFTDLIRSFPGEVLVFNHGYFNYLAGKKSYIHSSWYGDIVGSTLQKKNVSDAARGELVVGVLEQAIKGQIFDKIVVDNRPDQFLPYYFASVEPIFQDADVLYPVTGALSRPESILIKNPIVKGGTLPLNNPELSYLFVSGWQIDQGKLWGNSEYSILKIALENNSDYLIKFQFRPNCLGNQPIINAMDTVWNGEVLRTTPIDSCVLISQTIEINKDLIKKTWNQLSFHYNLVPSQATSISNSALLTGVFTNISFSQ